MAKIEKDSVSVPDLQGNLDRFILFLYRSVQTKWYRDPQFKFKHTTLQTYKENGH